MGITTQHKESWGGGGRERFGDLVERELERAIPDPSLKHTFQIIKEPISIPLVLKNIDQPQRQ